MTYRQIFLSVGAAIWLIAIATGQALAVPPPIPASFYGTVSPVEGTILPGVEISAWINGVKVISEQVILFEGTTVYTIDVPGDDPSTPEIEGGVHGDQIVFYIGSQRADQTGTWVSGSNQELNLTATQADGWVIFLPLFYR